MDKWAIEVGVEAIRLITIFSKSQYWIFVSFSIPPFTDESQFGTYKKILEGHIIWPKILEDKIEQ